ncbi:diaminopropionate ammonia-lyase [Frigidibacter sp. MR17.14]|uniref:diaminopropionate ammonia-lyase n=1 Tax=Frigidibacter sp. MR17.14 TaxID=3126509 RepID=UPI003012AC01
MDRPDFLLNTLSGHRQPLDPRDAQTLGPAAADRAAQVLALRENSAPTPLHDLAELARELGVGALHMKDEGFRLGLGSFKALGGAYALMILVQEEAARRLGREVAITELLGPEVRAVAATMTFACATDGNHGRSVAQGAELLGARAVIFVHAGVSEPRIDAIARFGARIERVAGGYDFSVQEAARIAGEEGWTVLSDTSWPGYEHIPGLVSQGYTAMVREILAEVPKPPTHVFLQAGVGGFAAAVAGHLALVLGDERPCVTIVEPDRAACLFASAKAGAPVRVDDSRSTVMAMLECHEPSPVAFRVLERVADAFLTLAEEDAVEAMRRLATPVGRDPGVVGGESGSAGLAGALKVARDPALAAAVGLGPQARVLVINTEGATDPALYWRLVGKTPEDVREVSA